MADRDVHSFETIDGQTLTMTDGAGKEIYALSYGNYGAAAIERQTRRGYRQDGATVIDYQLGVRSISITLYQIMQCSRQTYWEKRAELVDFFRPNRGGPITYTLRQSGGAKRSLIVYPEPGFTFPPLPADENGWLIEEPITFIAYDPLWFNPSANSLVVVGSNSQQLVFPITFPITFNPSGIIFTQNITYIGNWKSYPTITLTGPYTSATIENVTTGVALVLFIAIGTGAQRIIDLTPGAQSIVDNTGNDQWGDLAPESNLIDFNIRPDGIAPDGVTDGINELRVTLTDGVLGSSSAVISYYDRYTGI